jgi:hypothetical protein
MIRKKGGISATDKTIDANTRTKATILSAEGQYINQEN